MRWLTLTLLLVVCSCLHAQQAGIEGIAIDAVTRQPMAGVHITMAALSADGAPLSDADTYGAMSRQDGHFSITGMKPAIYVLEARHNGYFHLRAKTPTSKDDDVVTLKPGEPIKGLIVEMTPHAVIVGHVLDENGDPVEHAEVAARPAGKATMPEMQETGGRTDDRGQFRLVVPPGKFYVQAMVDRGTAFAMGRMGAAEIRSDGATPPVYGPTFYPAAASKDNAIALELSPGHEAAGIDIHLSPRRSVTISGTVTGMPAGTAPGMPAFITVLPVERGEGQFMAPAFTGPDGKFTISGLSPGGYRLSARFSAKGAELQSRSVEVRVDNVNQTGVTLALLPGETLSGVVEVEGAAKAGAAGKLNVRLEASSDGGRTYNAEVAENGAFHVDQVFAGKLRVRLMPLPENAYIKSIKLGNTEAKDDVLDLSGGVNGAAVGITISRNGAQLEGRIVGDDGQPPYVPFGFVFLAATPDDIDQSNLKFVQAGAKFTFTGVRPGRYRLIAVDPAILSGGPDNAENLKALFPRGTEIEIHEGDRLTKDVKVLPAENTDAKH